MRRALPGNLGLRASFGADQATHYNNPPANLTVVDDDGRETGRFQTGVPAGV